MSINQIIISDKQSQNDSDSNYKSSELIPKIHIIVPVFNESNAILNIIDRINTAMENHYDYRITVIDDGSSDSTYSLLKQSKYNLNLIRNDVNLGKGKTLKKGLNHTNPDEIIVMIDGDGEHPPEEILNILKPILNKRADVVIGSRFLNSEKKLYHDNSYLKNRKTFSHFRKLGNIFISILIFIFHHRYITDSQCGFRAFAPRIAQLFNSKYSGFEIETEMTIFYIRKKCKIVKVPIDTGLSTRESHMRIFRDSIRIFLVIIDMMFKKNNCIMRRFLS